MPTSTGFRVDLTSTPPVVEVDGVDQAASIDGLQLVIGFGEPSRLVLHYRATGTATGTATVEAVSVAPADAVRALDPGVIGPLILAAQEGGDMAADPAAVTLDVIARALEAGQ